MYSLPLADIESRIPAFPSRIVFTRALTRESHAERILERARKEEEADGSGPNLSMVTVAHLKAKAMQLHSRASINAGLF